MKEIRQFNRNVMILVVILLSIAGCTSVPSTLPTPPATASNTPHESIVLPALNDPVQRDYLGIETTGAFTLNDIQARVLIIEVFDYYCVHCQREAPNVNKLYRSITEDSNLNKYVKLIGFGVSNTTYEVTRFRNVYDISFPLFPDRSRDIARQLKVRKTPTFIGFARQTDGAFERFMFHPNPLGNVDEFLARVIRLSGLEKPQS